MGVTSEGQRRALQCKTFSCSTFCVGAHPAVRFKVGDEELNGPSLCFYLFQVCNVCSSELQFA